MNLVVDILHQLAFQVMLRRLKSYLKMSNAVLPSDHGKDIDITIDIAKDGSSCLCLTSDQVDKIVVISKGLDIYFSVLLMSKEQIICSNAIPKAALSLFYNSIINEANCKSLATFWQQPSGDVTMMCTRHINPLRMIFDSSYLQTLLDTTQQEVEEILVPLLRYKTKLLLDANSIYEEMIDDEDAELDEDLDADQDEKLDEGPGGGSKAPQRKSK